MRKFRNVALLLSLSILVGLMEPTGSTPAVHAADYISETEVADSERSQNNSADTAMSLYQ